MKKLMILSGAFFTSLTLLACLFKIQHWPGAGIGVTIGIAGMALIFIPSLAKYVHGVIK